MKVDYVELKKFIEKKFKSKIDQGIKDIETFCYFLKNKNINWRDIILLKEFVNNILLTSPDNINLDLEFFVQNNLLILFDKKLFKKNIITFENNKYFIFTNNEIYFDVQVFKWIYKIDSFNYFNYDELFVISNNGERKWSPKLKTQPNIVIENIKYYTNINKEIYKFFKKYHNL